MRCMPAADGVKGRRRLSRGTSSLLAALHCLYHFAAECSPADPPSVRVWVAGCRSNPAACGGMPLPPRFAAAGVAAAAAAAAGRG